MELLKEIIVKVDNTRIVGFKIFNDGTVTPFGYGCSPDAEDFMDSMLTMDFELSEKTVFWHLKGLQYTS